MTSAEASHSDLEPLAMTLGLSNKKVFYVFDLLRSQEIGARKDVVVVDFNAEVFTAC